MLVVVTVCAAVYDVCWRVCLFVLLPLVSVGCGHSVHGCV